MNFSDHVNSFNENLEITVQLPEGVSAMNPFENEQTRKLASLFYEKYYQDDFPRKLILGINPGRLGAGVTGVPFTDPVKLEIECGIPNNLKKVTEPSAGFIYDMISRFGGPSLFYSKYFINSVCPLGFIKEGVNYNYYDSKELEEAVKPFIISSLKKILEFNIDTNICYCLGNGKNFKFLEKLNKEQGFFGKIVPLPHPRWVVQYRRKQYYEFVEVYLNELNA